ncbi:hypothetical protein D9M71_270230 [compost metagenome]
MQVSTRAQLQVADHPGLLGPHFAVGQLQARLAQGIAGLAQQQVVAVAAATTGLQFNHARPGRLRVGHRYLAVSLDLLVALSRYVLLYQQRAKALGLGAEFADLGLRRADRGLGRLEIGVEFGVALAGLLDSQPGVFDLQLEGLGVEPKKQIAGLHMLIVTDGHFDHLPGHTRGDFHHRTHHLRLGRERQGQVGDQEINEQHGESHDSDFDPSDKSLIGSHGNLGGKSRSSVYFGLF